MAKLVIGTGYLGSRVASKWCEHGETVYATTRSGARAAELSSQGLQPIVADVTDRATLHDLPNVDTVLFSVGFDRKSGNSIEEVVVDGFVNVLDAMAERTRRLIYISTSGVYGQSDGSWINEQSACNPLRQGGRACLAAERRLSKHALGQRSVVLRLAGIYGPDRIPRRTELNSGAPIVASADSFLNLIHVEDAVRAVIAADQIADLPQLYLVSDGAPVRRREYFEQMARLLGVSDLRIEPPSQDDPASRRSRGSKRIDNRKVRQELNFSPRYPSFREGLAAVLAD